MVTAAPACRINCDWPLIACASCGKRRQTTFIVVWRERDDVSPLRIFTSTVLVKEALRVRLVET